MEERDWICGWNGGKNYEHHFVELMAKVVMFSFLKNIS